MACAIQRIAPFGELMHATIATAITPPVIVPAHLQMITPKPLSKQQRPFAMAGPDAKTIAPRPLENIDDTIATPVAIAALTPWLQGNQDSDFLISGFTNGFCLKFSSPPFNAMHANHKSARDNPVAVRSLISTELAAGRIADPFSSPPFVNFVVSPLGLVPKKVPGAFRLIHDLSYPKFGTTPSVNSGIDETDAAVSYETFDDVVQMVQQAGSGSLLAKTDIESAFRIIPIHPDDRYFLGFAFDGALYYDRCLPMGCRSSCAIFEAFSSAVQWIAHQKLGIPFVSHILDDFIFAGPSHSSVTAKSLDIFLDFCSANGILIKASKTVPPSTCIIAPGIEIDTVAMQARLPTDKLEKVQESLSALTLRRKATLHDLQSVIGLLVFASKVVLPGRAFLRRLINLTLKAKNPRHLITLKAFNGISVFPPPDFSDSETLKLYTDASGVVGFAAVLGSRWFSGPWHDSIAQEHITTKELFPLVLIAEIWGPLFSNRRVLFHSDNAAVVAIINKQSAPDSVTMILVRRLVVAILRHNVVFRAKHERYS
jgi:hypothetical protein